MRIRLGKRRYLAQTALNPLPIEHCEEQVRRVIQSATFRNATTLQQLLQFLAVKTLSGSSEIPKEYTIGVEVLGRKTDFDPKIDPIVRMRSHRLRLKLKEYYQVEGSRDPILIQFPKGHYFPTFEPMMDSANTGVVAGIGEHDEQTFAGDGPSAGTASTAEQIRSYENWKSILAAVIAIVVAVLAYWLGNWHAERRLNAGMRATAVSTATAANDRIVQVFWARFLGNDTGPGRHEAIEVTDRMRMDGRSRQLTEANLRGFGLQAATEGDLSSPGLVLTLRHRSHWYSYAPRGNNDDE